MFSKRHKKVFNRDYSGVQPGAGAAIPENNPSQASRKTQWGIMITVDCTEESHQLSAPDRVAGRMDLKLNGDVDPPSQMTHVTDNISESRRQDVVIHSSLLDASDQLLEVKAVECCEGSRTPSPNIEIISSLIDVFGLKICADRTLFEAGVLLTVGHDGEGYEVPVPKEHDEEKTISDSIMQFPEILPVDGDPIGSSEVGFSIEACNVGLDAAALLVGVHDADSPPGPPATLFDHHISGSCAELPDGGMGADADCNVYWVLRSFNGGKGSWRYSRKPETLGRTASPVPPSNSSKAIHNSKADNPPDLVEGNGINAGIVFAEANNLGGNCPRLSNSNPGTSGTTDKAAPDSNSFAALLSLEADTLHTLSEGSGNPEISHSVEPAPDSKLSDGVLVPLDELPLVVDSSSRSQNFFFVAPAVWVGWRDCNFASDQFLLMPGVGRDRRMATSDKQLKDAGSCIWPFCWVVASSL
ncbi:hypothetical protein Nepgr_007836 [Nepenthes gracilis]|uniref:Uncharacterized protein n=1 Tax=Nepenthes gracilis TaxID=150966 RepID=A0AAD3S809_NEPGR|nr:hypothetical protein Nepgr_007836 [Nepenthes gracilis]